MFVIKPAIGGKIITLNNELNAYAWLVCEM